jgi:uncharacterized protein (TIGR02679 family)
VSDTQPLDPWARLAGPSKVINALSTRAERGHSLDSGRLQVDLTPEERQEVGQLLGVSWASSGKPVTVQLVNNALARHGLTSADLTPVKAALERRALRLHNEAARLTAQEQAIQQLGSVGLSEDVSQAAVKRLRAADLHDDALIAATGHVATVVAALTPPGNEVLPLSVLASQLFGDPHALDRSTLLGRTTARVLAAAASEHGWQVGEITTAEAWRNTWAASGVACDEVSSLVLVAGLRLEGDSPAVRICAAAAWEPTWLSLLNLRGTWRPATDTQTVFVCENPVVVEAATARLGQRCPPLVCTFGRPSTAALTLLRGLHTEGVELMVRADEDETGRGIVAQLRSLAPTATPWRFPAGPDALEPEIRYEEDLLEQLLEDLEAASSHPSE